MPTNPVLEGDGFLREPQIVGPLLPISRRSWWRGIKLRRYPQGVKLGRLTVWRKSDIRKMLEEIAGGAGKAA